MNAGTVDASSWIRIFPSANAFLLELHTGSHFINVHSSQIWTIPIVFPGRFARSSLNQGHGEPGTRVFSKGGEAMSCKSWWRRGNENMTNTPERDWLFGGRGHNTIDGRGGNDFIWAGRGNDTVLGGEGHDWVFSGTGDDVVESEDGNDRIHAGHGDDVVDGGAGNDSIHAGSGDDVVIHNVTENAGFRDYYDGGRGSDVLVLQMTHAEFNSAAVQADLSALDALLSRNGGCFGQAFQFEAFDLRVRNFERYEIELTDAIPRPLPINRQTAPQAQDDIVLVATGVVPIVETESNDPNGLPLADTAQVIERSSFRVEPSADVGDDTLPRVSIEGSIAYSSDASQIPEPNPNDVDLYAITLKAGETLILDIDYGFNPLLRKSLITQLFVQDADGNVLADNYQAPTTLGGDGSVSVFDAYLEFTDSGAGGTYYVSVSSFDNDPATAPGEFNNGGMVTGEYVLNVSIGNPAPDLGALVITSDMLIANDIDADGDTLTIVSVGNPVNGEVEISAEGQILFRPVSDDSPGSFDYTVSDGNGGESTASVTVNGNPVIGTASDDTLVSTPDADMLVGGSGGDTFNFATGSGNDTIADFEAGIDSLHITDTMGVASVREISSNDTLVSFDTGDSVLLVGVTGVSDPNNDLFV